MPISWTCDIWQKWANSEKISQLPRNPSNAESRFFILFGKLKSMKKWLDEQSFIFIVVKVNSCVSPNIANVIEMHIWSSLHSISLRSFNALNWLNQLFTRNRDTEYCINSWDIQPSIIKLVIDVTECFPDSSNCLNS